MLEYSATLLDVKSKYMKEFVETDPFNPQNIVTGYCCRKSDHRYGALVITKVNSHQIVQVIYCTPKLQYPFGRIRKGESNEERSYNWPKISKLRVYNKLDGCFEYQNPVILADGTQRWIGLIHRDHQKGIPVHVLSYNTQLGQVVRSRVAATHKFKQETPCVSLEFEKPQFTGIRRDGRTICTQDHPFMSSSMEWVEAGKLMPGQEVMQLSKELQPHIKSMLVGCILGDAYISQTGQKRKENLYGSPFVEFRQANKEYLFWKYNLLQNITNSAPREVSTGYGSQAWTFGTQCTQALSELATWFLDTKGKKVVLSNIESLLNPLAIAFWYMDDGSLQGMSPPNKQPRLTFNTQGFLKEEVEILRGALEKLYGGYISKIKTKDKYWIITAGVEATDKILNAIAPYIHESMDYKLPPKFRCKVKASITKAEETYHLIPVKVKSVDKAFPRGTTGKYVYDLTVENTENYFVADRLVHNTNICNYSYRNHKNDVFSTFKTRLTAFLKESYYGNFLGLWKEILIAHPELTAPEEVLSEKYTLSYEMYGYRNPHLIVYPNVSLSTRLLFAVQQDLLGSSIIPPHELPGSQLSASMLFDRNWEKFASENELTKIYEDFRNTIEKKNKKQEDGTILGSEGAVFYVYTENNRWEQLKCKPKSIETEHWASDSIPTDIILPTAWNALESCEGILTAEYVSELLEEEFSHTAVQISFKRIQKVVVEVIKRIELRNLIIRAFQKTGLSSSKNTKKEIMRAISKYFNKKEMKVVFGCMLELGLVEKN